MNYLNKAVKVWISPGTLGALEQASDRLEVSTSEYCRNAIAKALERDRLGSLKISPEASKALVSLEAQLPPDTDLLEYLLENQDPYGP
jgi:hypothetical protein